jgi:hypothetical protein
VSPTGQVADPGGPLVALCVGHRCAALRRLAGTPGGVADIGAAVHRTRGALLVTVGCVGGCDRAALAALAHRAPQTGRPGPTLWLSEVQTPERTAGLIAWLDGSSGATASDPPAIGRLPDSLRPAVTGTGPPVRISSST